MLEDAWSHIFAKRSLFSFPEYRKYPKYMYLDIY